jgi:hypothetical protein
MTAPTALRHWVRWDEPSATSRSLQKTLCGIWVQPRAVVTQREQITCEECARLVALHETENPQ